jgi:hypothetical protein
MERAMRQVPQVVKGGRALVMGRLVMLGLAVLLTGPVDARAELRVEFGETGVFAVTPLRREPEPGSPAGFRMLVTDVKLMEATETICARMGLTFGTRYKVRGGRTGDPVQLTMVTRFPPECMTAPDGRRHTVSRTTRSTAVDADEVRLFGFDEPFEIVAGQWVFEFHHEGRKLAETSFRVIRDCGTS